MSHTSYPATQHTPDPDRAARATNAAWAARRHLTEYRRPLSPIEALERRIEALEAELYRLSLRDAA